LNRLEPLGIDLGETRVRVAVSERGMRNGARIRMVAARDLPAVRNQGADDDDSCIINDMLRDHGITVRECVAALGAPHASLRATRFPSMRYFERRRAARLDAAFDGGGGTATIVRIHPIDTTEQYFAVARTTEEELKRRLRVLRGAGLRVVGIDYDGCALARIFSGFDAVIDVGRDMTRLHAFANGVPSTWAAPVGGQTVTRAIAEALSIDLESAERRKRILGLAGAPEDALGRCADAIRELFASTRLQRLRTARVGMIGNGARLPGLAQAIGERCALRVELPVPELLRRADFADDVLREASPDWTLASALTTWRAA
jgi:hypothetical protein